MSLKYLQMTRLLAFFLAVAIFLPNAHGEEPPASTVEILETGSTEERLRVLELLKREGATPALVAPLTNLLGDPDPDVRVLSAGVLEDLGAHARPAMSALSQLSRDEDPTVRRFAYDAISAIGADLPGTVVPILEQGISDSDEIVRATALRNLARFGTNAERSASAVMGALSDKTLAVRVHAAVALVAIDPSKANLAVNRLIEIIEDNDTNVVQRGLAIDALAKIGPAAKQALPSLGKFFTNRELRFRAAVAALAIDARHEAGLQTLQSLLLSKDLSDRAFAARALLMIRSDDLLAATALVRILDNGDAATLDTLLARTFAIETLLTLDEGLLRKVPGSASTLRRNLDARDEFVRYGAAIVLSRLEPSGHRELVPALVRALEESHEAEIRRLAAVSLGKFSGDARSAIPALNRAMKDESQGVQQAAKDALQQIGSAESQDSCGS